MASPGDELILAGTGIAYTGTGSQVLLIDKTLTIRGGWDGAGTGPVVIDPAAHHSAISGAGTRRVVRAQLDNETLTLDGITIADGGTTESDGGGMWLTSPSTGTVNMSRVEVTANGNVTPPSYGGGVYAANISLNITGCTFSFNNALSGGGGLKIYQSTVEIADSRFEQNSATYGSAIEVENPSPVTIERSVFVRHLSGSSVILLSDADPALVMTNNYIIHNQGVMIDAMGGDLDLLHNTYSGDGAGTGLMIGSTVTGNMRNNILYAFTNSILLEAGSPSFVISHTLFHDNTHDAALGSDYVLGDPCLVDPFADEQGFHIANCSAAIDAGEDAGILEDYDGDLRPRLGAFDIGADEFGWLVFLPLVLR